MSNIIGRKRKRTKDVNESSDSEFSGFSEESKSVHAEKTDNSARITDSDTSSDDNMPSTSDGRRRRKDSKYRATRNNRISQDHNGTHPEWFTLERVTDRIHPATNTSISSYKVNARPGSTEIQSLADYQNRIEELFGHLIAEVSAGHADDAETKFMIFSDHLDAPIRTAHAPLGSITPDAILQAIEDVFQSNKEFISDEEFTFYAVVTPRPRGMGLRSHRVVTAKEAVSKLQSIINVKTPGGLCLPACLLLGQAKAFGDMTQYEQWRKTERRPIRLAAEAYAELVLGRIVDPKDGCTFDDLDKFQEEIADSFQIKVYRWGPPSRKCIYVGKTNAEHPHYITLLYEDQHFNLITRLPGFFQSNNYCHICEKPYSDERTHRCLVKCKGCLKVNCPDKDEPERLLCSRCNRYFPGQRCFDCHKLPNRPGQRSICSRVKYCPSCGRQQCEWGSRKNRHVCGGTFCKNCDKYVETNHRCYMKRYKEVKHHSMRDPTGTYRNGLDSDSDDDDEGDIGENMARAQELEDGLITGPDANDEALFEDAKLCYFDAEAYVRDEDGIHVPNLIVAQWLDDGEVIFEGDDATDQFCRWAICRQHKGWTFISHYGRKYDSFFVQKWILENGNFKPYTILQGCSIMLLAVKQFNIRFIDSGCFISAPLAKLPTIFGLQDKIQKGTFPHRFNKPENYLYEGPMPPIEVYDTGRMSSDNRTKFIHWYEERKQSGYIFKFWPELVAYCRADVKVLRLCCRKFREVFFQQSSVDPFSCITIASAVNKTFRKLFLTKNEIACIPPAGYSGNDVQSHAALEWLGWMAHSTGLRIRHRNNGGEVEVLLSNSRKAKLDGACREGGRKIAFEFYGCWFHGCPTCFTQQTFNPMLRQNMADLYQATMKREQALKQCGWHLETIWQCQYEKLKNVNADVRSFVASHGAPRPLDPRESFMGGRVNAIQLICKAPPGTAIRYYDINSLYPYCNKYMRYPTKHPVIMGESEIDLNNFDQYHGLCYCVVLPPQDLYHPLLGYKARNKLLFPLCKTCADNEDQGPCTHSADDRALTGVWTTIELQKGINDLGYSIIRAFELWHFEESSDSLFKGMMNMYLKSKQEARGYPAGCITEQEKADYIDDYFNLEGVQLDSEKIENNPGRYANSKICLNSVWGKFGEREQLPNTVYIDNEVEFWQLLKNDQYTVVDYCFPTNNYVQVTYIDKKACLLPNLHTNIIVATYTTALARLELYKSLEKLQNRVLYFDTGTTTAASSVYKLLSLKDSVIFFDDQPQNPNRWRPPVGEQLGVYKDEVGADDHITEAAFAGPKNYLYRTHNGKTCMKVRGFTLNHMASEQLTAETMRDLIQRQDKNTAIHVDMGTSIKRNKSSWTLSNCQNVKQYRFKYDKRILLTNYTTIPFGYTGPMPQPVGIVPQL